MTIRYFNFQEQCDEIERLLSAFCGPALSQEILDDVRGDVRELYNELIDTAATFIPSLKAEKILDQIADDAVAKFIRSFDELPESAWDVDKFATPVWSQIRQNASEALNVFRTQRRMLASK